MERSTLIPPRLAIIDEDMLRAIGLRSLLEPIARGLDICIYDTFERFAAVSHNNIVHYFISSKVFFEHRDEFVADKFKVMVLVCGNVPYFSDTSFRTINVSVPEQELVKNLLRVYEEGHNPLRPNQPKPNCSGVLSRREKEVLRMAVMGFLNKEIADKYSISLTTVISHRRKIVEKLGFKSLSALTVYAVTNGIVGIEEI